MRFRSLVVLSASALVWIATPACAKDQEVRVVRDGRIVSLSRGGQVAANLVALGQSSSVNSTDYAVTADTWPTVLGSDSFVLVEFSNPRRLWLAGRAYRVRGFLLPLPSEWPPHLYVKTVEGIIAVTKYEPRAMKRLVLEPQLGLLNTSPYSSLLLVPDPPSEASPNPSIERTSSSRLRRPPATAHIER
jgi:hypothetical protein